MNNLLKTAGLAIALLAGAPAAHAQIDMGTGMPVMDWIGPQLAADRMGQMLGVDRNGHKIDEAKPAGATSRPANSPTARLAYTPTPALKAQTVQGYVDRLKTKNPAASQAVAANLGPGHHDYGTIYHGLVQGTGLRDNDAADNLAAFMVLGWMIVNDVQEAKALPAGAPQGVRAQLAPKLAGNAQLAAPGVPAQLGEEMKLLFVITQGGWQSALKEHTLPAYQQGVAAMFKTQYGLDMSLVKLTPQGFAKR